jgi:serine/threonine-protein phosphatase 6 regulatory subunit 3
MLGDLLKLLDITSAENVLPTTYGCLRPPLGKHRLKVHSDAVNLFTFSLSIHLKPIFSALYNLAFCPKQVGVGFFSAL